MKNSVILLFILFIVSAFIVQKNVFKVEYTNSTQSVTIISNEIVVAEYIESYDNPMSSIPSGRVQQIKRGTLSDAQLQALKTKIESSGFMKLPKNYYGASKDERYYSYTIATTMGKKIKSVVYANNPAPQTEKMPEAFKEVEQHLLKLLKEVPMK